MRKQKLKKLTNNQKKLLKNFWGEVKGNPKHLDDFLGGLDHFLEYSSPLISDSNRKSETEERNLYKKISVASSKLASLLENVSDLDRVNNISKNKTLTKDEILKGYLYDPLDLALFWEVNARDFSLKLKDLRKYERQLTDLRNHIKRYVPLKKASNSQLIDIACILWPNINPDSFSKALQKKEKNYKK